MVTPDHGGEAQTNTTAVVVVAAKKTTKHGKSGFGSYVANRLACFWNKSSEPAVEGNCDVEVDDRFRRRNASHLIFMVNGLIGSAQDWNFAAKKILNKYRDDVVVHCSECNPSKLTFDGVDVMGERLAEEVINVVKRHPSVVKISFIAHSLGGLVARYAIARLYERDVGRETVLENGDCKTDDAKNLSREEGSKGKIAGLEPVNFITSATPHLGSWGHKQVPVFCGLYSLERLASRTSWFLGKSGKHLFLTDGGDDGKPPLLVRMTGDTENLKFISALQSFQRRVAYANVHFDHIVGWSTSSLRHHNELPVLKMKTQDDRYPHIVNVEPARISSTQEVVPTEAKVKGVKNINMEERMLKGLTKLSWERVDVSFHGSTQRYLAHNTIQVQGLWNSDGADVIQHMIDNFLL